jgi:hypothetical protein
VGGGPVVEGAETDEVGFVGHSDLPRLSIARVTPGQMARFFDHGRNPHWPTGFD